MDNRTRAKVLFVAAVITGITLFHYFTPLHLPALHDVMQRLYYLPIILAAYWFGLRGGIVASLATSLLYVPHVLFQWGDSPFLELEKYLEIVLFNVVGGVTGFLSQQEERRREALEESYRKLQRQADMIISIEEQLRNAERLSTVGELSASLAHEIRNPLGSIRGAAEILRDDFRPDDRKYEFLEIMIRETDRLNRVVEDFLSLARPLRDGQQKCDVSQELRQIATLVEREATQRGVLLDLQVTECPPVNGDSEKLRQVFLNLFLNAIQATGRGGRVTVTAGGEKSADGEGARIIITFSDTGMGIPQDVLGKIFTPFFTTKAGGTGLGLAIAQKIVESHDGSIDVESEPGRGTTFRVGLPC